MLEIYFIRHGKTYGNTLGRYIGTTDESLCEEGRKRLQAGAYPEVEAVYASPMKRCLETAAILYPGLIPETEERLRECDFGEFENRNYLELSGNPAYQAWVDSGGTLPFPGGESQEAFKKRCREGFQSVLKRALPGILGEQGTASKLPLHRMALVVHGGTIMSILEAFGSPRESFYHWQAKNGEGFRALLDLETYEKREEVRLYDIHAVGPFSGISA